MSPAEKIRVLIFLGFVVFVYVAAFSVLVSLLINRKKFRLTGFKKIILGSAVIGLLCFAYGLRVEPYWPQTKFVSIDSPKIKNGNPAVRIVQLSDLHSDHQPRLEKKIPDIIKNLNPDIIIFTGDAINSPEGLPVFKDLLKELVKIAPVYAVRGNWDVNFWNALDVFDVTGVTDLNQDAVTINVRENKVTVSGIAAYESDKIDGMLDQIPGDSFNLLLYHYPLVLTEAQQTKIDLVCSGHVHGGQIAMPFYGALVTLSPYGKKYESGLYRTGNSWLYVNRGIGMEGGAPRVRFFARPEITLFDIY